MEQSSVKSIKNRRILLSPLNWGYGHVTRTIPIIKQLLLQDNTVIICCDDEQKSFYLNYFPDLNYTFHKGYPFKFGKKGNFTLDILKSYKSLSKYKKKEKQLVKKYVEKYKIDLIISDQRFGFHHPAIESIIISHQLKLPVPFWNILAQKINKKELSKFSGIWVPDDIENSLSGVLSKSKFSNVSFIGNCSRFDPPAENIVKNVKYLGIVSGPRPHADKMVSLLIEKLLKLDEKSIIVVPKLIAKNIRIDSEKIQLVVEPNHEELNNLFDISETVISRAGYSSLMDLKVKGNEAILIPTPGQAEQIYLASYHTNHPKWEFVKENDFMDEFMDVQDNDILPKFLN